MPAEPAPPDDLPIDPSTGEPIRAADMRAEFARMSERDAEAERAFLAAKIATIRTDPTLTDDEKQAAVEEVRRKGR